MRSKGTVLATLFLLGSALLPAQTTLPASSADWIVGGQQPTGSFGRHVASAGDIDGDGYADVLIGDAMFDGGFTDSGQIGIYRGSASGLSQTPAWILGGSAAGSRLSVAYPAGDLNGDGFDDLIVRSTPLSVYLGSSAGPMPTSWASAGSPLGRGGDVNGDGLSDVAVFTGSGISIFHGSASGLAATPSTSLALPAAERPEFLDAAIAKDLDADGYDDLVYTWRYCARNCDYLIAELRVHPGSASGLASQPKRTFIYKVKYQNLAPFVASAGDVDGDGFGDVALTLRPDLAGGFDPDEVHWLAGSRSGLSARSTFILWTTAGTLYSGSVDGAGDVDGDGYADLLVPVQNFIAGLDLLIVTGGPAGFSATPAVRVTPEPFLGSEFAAGAAGAGDVNGDGLDDFIVGDPAGFGRVYVFLGRPGF